MSITLIKPSFSAGELAPSIWGRSDFGKWHVGASVMRNMYVSYRGGASSRAGLMFVGQTLQPASASSLPPRIIRFQFNIFQNYILEFGDHYMRVVIDGAYVTDTPQNVTGATQANPAQLTVPGHGYAAGDWVAPANIGGMTELNGNTYIVTNPTVNTFTLKDTFGIPVNSLGYHAFTAGGTVARIYTTTDSPYAVEDLDYLKFTQDKNVMTLTCVNQITGAEYPAYDLTRILANQWTFEQTTFGSSIAPPATCTAVATVATGTTHYSFVVTAVDAVTGDESVASPVANVDNSVDIAITAGSLRVTWAAVAGAAYYNVYQAPPAFDTPVPIGSSFGLIGQAFGTEFVNSNIVPDFAQTPPLHLNPFARGSLLRASKTAVGYGYSQSTTTAVITSATGHDAVLTPVVVGGDVVALIIPNGGEDYQPGDPITINATLVTNVVTISIATPGVIGWVAHGQTAGTPIFFTTTGAIPTGLLPSQIYYVSSAGLNVDDFQVSATHADAIAGTSINTSGSQSGTHTAHVGGNGAQFVSVIGPETGTYPGVADYFQQRRVYAYTLNSPDTYFMTQPGAPYQNMDAASPPVDSDAITGTPWGKQINGIQWLLPLPGGLIVATGRDAWQVGGTNGPGSLITPAQQSAVAQENNGFSPTVRPLQINYDIVYVQTLGAIVRVLPAPATYSAQAQSGTDIGILSNHLFEGFQITQWAWAKEPNKLIWAARSDGKFLSCAYLREQELIGWSRHDTNGFVVSVEVATEPPVDAPYFLVKRFIVGVQQWAYYLERMDNRLWQGPEDPWCVDCGLALAQPAPDATLSAASAEGPGNITGGYLATSGVSYTDPGVQIVDPAGTGSGAEISLITTGTAPNKIVTGFTIDNAGADYSPGTYALIEDTTGAGATLVLFISQNVLFSSSSPVFGATLINDVIRIGGGQANVTAINNPSQVLASITVPIINVIPNDPNRLPVPAPSGAWTITTPVQTLTNLHHLEGMQVAILADGAVQPQQTVVNGGIVLQRPASSIKVGLPFVVQLQTMNSDTGQPTVQGKRQNVTGGTLRVEKSRGIQVGSSRPVASALDYQQEIPWTRMQDLPDLAQVDVPAAALPLFTGDKFAPVGGDWYNWNGFEPSPGRMCAQQSNPLPMNILAMYPEVEFGDANG